MAQNIHHTQALEADEDEHSDDVHLSFADYFPLTEYHFRSELLRLHVAAVERMDLMLFLFYHFL
jgi:hypothetical protein